MHGNSEAATAKAPGFNTQQISGAVYQCTSCSREAALMTADQYNFNWNETMLHASQLLLGVIWRANPCSHFWNRSGLNKRFERRLTDILKESFTRFVKKISTDLPDYRIAYTLQKTSRQPPAFQTTNMFPHYYKCTRLQSGFHTTTRLPDNHQAYRLLSMLWTTTRLPDYH